MSDFGEASACYQANVDRAHNGNIQRFFSPVALIYVHLFVAAEVSSVSCTSCQVVIGRSVPSALRNIYPAAESNNPLFRPSSNQISCSEIRAGTSNSGILLTGNENRNHVLSHLRR